jgi:hypothetical protein
MNLEKNIKTASINKTKISYVAFDDISSINEINNNIETNNKRIAIWNEELNILNKESEKKTIAIRNYIKTLNTLRNDLTLVTRCIDDISNCRTNIYNSPLKEKSKELINKLSFVVEDESIYKEDNIYRKKENEKRIHELKEKNNNNINYIKLINNNNIQQYLNIEIDYFNNIYNIRNNSVPNLSAMYYRVKSYNDKISHLRMANFDLSLTNIIKDTQKALDSETKDIESIKSQLSIKNMDRLGIHSITFSIYKYLIESLMCVPIEVNMEGLDYASDHERYITYKTFYYRGFIKIPFKLAIPCLFPGLYIDNIVLKDKFYFPSEIGFISKPGKEIRECMELMGFVFSNVDDKYGDKIVEANSRGHILPFGHDDGPKDNCQLLRYDIPKSHIELVYKIFTC